MTLIVLNPFTSLASEKDGVPSSYGNHDKKLSFGFRLRRCQIYPQIVQLCGFQPVLPGGVSQVHGRTDPVQSIT